MYEVVFNTDDIVLLSGNITCSPILGYILHDNVETQSILDNYDKYYNDYNDYNILYPQPYNNIPQTATVLRSVPNSNSYPASWRTIPAGITTEYVAHEEIILHVSRQDYKQYR